MKKDLLKIFYGNALSIYFSRLKKRVVVPRVTYSFSGKYKVSLMKIFKKSYKASYNLGGKLYIYIYNYNKKETLYVINNYKHIENTLRQKISDILKTNFLNSTFALPQNYFDFKNNPSVSIRLEGVNMDVGNDKFEICFFVDIYIDIYEDIFHLFLNVNKNMLYKNLKKYVEKEWEDFISFFVYEEAGETDKSSFIYEKINKHWKQNFLKFFKKKKFFEIFKKDMFNAFIEIENFLEDDNFLKQLFTEKI